MPTFIEEDDGTNGSQGGLPPKAEDLIKFARADAADIGIDPDVAERRIRVESRGISNALSPKGAFGAAQLMPDTATELSRRYGGDPRDPYDNVRLGNRYYKEQLDRYGNDTLAAAAYNAGPGAVDRHGGVPPYRETRDYVAKVANGRAGGVRIPDQDRKPFDPYADWSAKGEWEIAEPIRNAGPAVDGRQEPSTPAQEDSGKPWLSREWERQKGNLSIAWNGMMNSMDGHIAAGLGELISSRQGKALTPGEKAEDDNNRREFDAAMSRIQGRNSESSALQGKARPETQEFMGAAGGGWNWSTAAKIGDALIKNPVGVTSDVIVQSSLPSLAGMATAILARFSGGSANAAALAGGLGGSAFIEFGNDYAENRANGMPHDRAWAAAGAKSTVVGTLDAVSFKTAGSALEGVLSKSGFGKKAGIVGKEVGRQAFLGAAGEAGGSLAAGQKPDPVAVVSEAIAEVGGAPGEALSTFRGQKNTAALAPDIPGGAQDSIPANEFLPPDDPSVSTEPAPDTKQPPEAQPQPSVPNVPEPSRALPPIEITRGSPTTFSTEDGDALDGDFALVDADQLIASHDINLRKNPLFPEGLQPRQRERAASELQISNIVSKINPARLGASPDVANGAPIIGDDGVVESGNGRTIALQRVYQANGAKAASYRQWLKDHAGEFGIDPANVDSLSKPILVRVRNTPVNRAEFARQANTSTVAAMSTGELANADAARIGHLEDLVLTEDGDITGSANRPFVNRFVGSLTPAEQSGLLDAHGRLSQAGYSRVRNAILARAYGDSPVLMRMTESVDDNLRNLTTALARVAPRVAKEREYIAAGAMHDADLTSDLLSAVEELSQLKSDGRSVKEYLAQQDLVGDKLTAEGRELIAFLDDNLRSPKRIAAFIVDYFDVLAGFGNPSQEALFGTEQAPQRSQIIALAKEKQNAEPGSPAESKPEPGTAKPAPDRRAEPPGGNQTADQVAGEQERAQGSSESAQPAAVDEWLTFGKESGSLGIPRADMPQIKAAHRGALTQFLAGRGIEHENVEVDPKSLFPTQSEFNPAKVKKWRDRKGQTDRSLLISSDNYILDGHHQWLAALADGDASESAIRFSAPIRELLAAAAEFPSVESAPGNQASPPAFSLESQSSEDLANKESRAQDESIADRETADREREVFALTPQAPEKTAGTTSQSGLFTPDGRATEAAGQKPQAEAQPAVQPIVEHVTARGKTIRGVIRNDLTKEQAKAIDPFAFRKGGGWFIRERYVDGAPPQKAPEPAKKAPEPAKQKETTPPKPDAKAEKLAHQVRVLREQGTLHVQRAEEDYGRDRNTNTARRARMAAGAEADAAARKQIGETMLKLADALESGSAPELSGFTTRAQIELIDRIMLNAMHKRDQKEFSYSESERRKGRPFEAADLKYVEYPRAAWLENAITNLNSAIKGKKGSVELARKIKLAPYFTAELNAELKKLIDDKKIKDAVGWWAAEAIQRVSRLERSGIRDLVQLQAAVKRYAELRADKTKPDAIKEAERALVGSKVGIDFFPTPAAVASRMVETAGIEPGMSVLEPSAGNGNIAEEIRKAGVEPDVVEISESLRNVLKAKGFNIVGHDFNDTEGKYDRIVMNPPFSKNQDIEHVRRAHGMLKPGGRLVAIVGEGAFSRSGKTEQAFRDWLESAGAEVEKLPAGTFTDKSLLAQTSANARLVVIEAGEGHSVEQRTKRDEYTKDLFGNQIPDKPVPSTSGKQPAPATTGDLHAAGAVPGAKYATVAGPRKSGEVRSAVETVSSAVDAAHVLAGIRKLPHEHFVVLILDQEKKPISIARVAMGATTKTSVYPEVVTKVVYEVPGARHIWFAHNHPSGVAMPSTADVQMTSILSQAFGPGTGITVDGHVIIAGTSAVEMDADGAKIGPSFNIKAGNRVHSIPIIERVFSKVGTLGGEISAPATALADVPRISGKKTGIVFANSQNFPVAFLPMSVGQMQRLRDGSSAAALFGAAARSNATAAFVNFSDDVTRGEAIRSIRNLYEALTENRDIRVLDGIHLGESLAQKVGSFSNGGGGVFGNVTQSPWYYSALRDAFANSKQNAMPASQWATWLQGNAAKLGVKSEEIQFSGIIDWLQMQEGRVSKPDIIAYLDSNGVKVTETRLGQQDEDGGDETKFGEYTLPGGENYREVLLTLPRKHRPGSFSIKNKDTGGYIGDFATSNEASDFYWNGPRADEFAAGNFAVVAVSGGNEPGYKSVHWNQPNVLAHIRLNDRTSVTQLTERQQADNRQRIEMQAKADALAKKIGDASRNSRIAGDIRREELLAELRPLVRAGKMTPMEMTRRLDDAAFAEVDQEVTAAIRERDAIIKAMPPERKPATARVLFVEEIQGDWPQAIRKQRDAIGKAVDADFNGIIERMKKAGVLTVNCD